MSTLIAEPEWRSWMLISQAEWATLPTEKPEGIGAQDWAIFQIARQPSIEPIEFKKAMDSLVGEKWSVYNVVWAVSAVLVETGLFPRRCDVLKGLSPRTVNCYKRGFGVVTPDGLSEASDLELMTRNAGKKTIAEIREHFPPNARWITCSCCEGKGRVRAS